jgi:hypothetical protein
MAKFKVGDRVRIIKTNLGCDSGKVSIIESIDLNYEFPYQTEFGWAMVELVEEEKCEPCGITIDSSNIQTTISDMVSKLFIDDAVYKNGLIGELAGYTYEDYKPKQTIMSKITTFAKNLVLSADEKLLRKYGLKDECGEFTDEAESLVMAKLVKENEAYLVELATAMQSEEAKK